MENEKLPGTRLGHPLGVPVSQSKEGHPLHGTPHSRTPRAAPAQADPGAAGQGPLVESGAAGNTGSDDEGVD